MSYNLLAGVAGALSAKGHVVEAVLTREDMAWDNLDDMIPNSIADMLVEVTEHPHGGNKNIDKAISILGLTSIVEILDSSNKNANTVQNQHAALVHGLHDFLDTRYVGYDTHMYITQFRAGAKTVIMLCKKSEADALNMAASKYRKWVTSRGAGWAPQQFEEGFEQDIVD